MKSYNRGFTLAEIIVVIAIIAILSTIGFISYTKYTSSSRDAVRWADIMNMNRILSLHKTSRLRYPKASDAVQVSYSWAKIWDQWVFWKETIVELGKIFGDLEDPKFNNKYTYSVTANKKEYQLWAVFENESDIPSGWASVALGLPSLTQQVHASTPFSPSELSPVVWLDSTDVNGDGTTETYFDGANLSSWINKWSWANPTLTDGNLRYSTNGYDSSYPGVFIANNRGLLLNDSDITQWDIFYAVQNNDPFGSTDYNGRALQSSNGNMLIGYWWDYRNSLYISGAPWDYNTSPATWYGRDYQVIYGFHTDNTNYSFYDTGYSIDQWSTNTITGQIWAFNTAGQSAQYADWVVSEVLIFDTKLSDNDRKRVEWYLAHKWWQESWLPYNHPYESEPPESSGPPPAPDTTPDSFSFNNVSDADLSTEYSSNSITVTWINTASTISITWVWSEYSINNGAYQSWSNTVTVNDTVRVRLTSSSSNNTPITATLNIGGVTSDFTITTLVADITPDSFSFNAVTDADINTSYTSNTITVSWLNTAASISITWAWAEYKISDGIPYDTTWAWTPSASSTYYANTPAGAFDNNTYANGWWNNGSLPSQLNYDFWVSNDQRITRYTLYRSSGQNGWWNSWSYSPGNWTFEWSDNGTDWTVLDTQVNQFISVDATKKQYSFTNPDYYRYYRINISSADGYTSWVNITEMELINESWGWSFTNVAGTVTNDDIISVRMPSSSSAGTLKTAALTIGTESSNYNITTTAPDTTPNSFSFTDVNNASLSQEYTSNSVTIGWINAPTPISISGVWEYRVNGWSYTSSAGTINNGDVINIRQTSAWLNSVTVSSTLNIGWRTATYNVTTPAPPPDTTPDSFSFTSVNNANVSTVYQTNTITVSGVNTTVPISVVSGWWEYDINNANSYTSSAWNVTNGDIISFRNTSSNSVGSTVTTQLSIGWVTADFDITTVAADTTPDSFTLNDISSANTNQVYISNPVTVSGINTSVSANISSWAGEMSINGWSYVTSGTVYDGDTITVRITAPWSWWANVSTTLSIGSQSDAFQVTTWAWDTVPDNFSFNSVSDATLNTQYISDTVTITGINASANISVTNGEYRIWALGGFTSSPWTIENGQEVTVRMVSAITWETAKTVNLNIGWVSWSYVVTTQEFIIAEEDVITLPTSNIYVSGEYNGLIAHAQDGDTHYIIATPSIMTYDYNDTDIISILENKKLVYHGFKNVPASYSWSNLTMSGGFDFNVTSPLLYEWNKEDLWSYGGLKQIDEWIRSTYNNFPYYKNVAEYLDDYSLWYLEKIIGNIIWINPIKPYYCSDILQSKLVYNIAPQATITASVNSVNAYGTWGIANGIKSTQWDLDYEYHSDDGNAMIEFEWEKPQRVGYVRIYNRTGCCSERLSWATVKLYNNFGWLIYSHPLWNTSGDYVIDLDLEWIGHLHDVKKLTLESVWWNVLNLREVEIFLWWNVKSWTYKVDKDGLWGQSPYNVYCDMETDGGGWTRIGEDYIENGDFAGSFHIDQYTFPYGASDVSVNVIKTDVAPPSYLPDARVLQHNGSAAQSYPLYFDDIPGEYFAQEIRISAWVKWTSSSIFNNTINYDDGSSSTTTPDFEVLETDGAWEYRMVRLPLDGLVSDFTWDIAKWVTGPMHFTGVKMEVYYK